MTIFPTYNEDDIFMSLAKRQKLENHDEYINCNFDFGLVSLTESLWSNSIFIPTDLRSRMSQQMFEALIFVQEKHRFWDVALVSRAINMANTVLARIPMEEMDEYEQDRQSRARTSRHPIWLKVCQFWYSAERPVMSDSLNLRNGMCMRLVYLLCLNDVGVWNHSQVIKKFHIIQTHTWWLCINDVKFLLADGFGSMVPFNQMSIWGWMGPFNKVSVCMQSVAGEVNEIT